MPDPDEELGRALHTTRMVRLGPEAMWSAVDFRPDKTPVYPDVRSALVIISDWLEKWSGTNCATRR